MAAPEISGAATMLLHPERYCNSCHAAGNKFRLSSRRTLQNEANHEEGCLNRR